MDFLTMSEAELVSWSQRGNQEAMDQLVKRHWEAVYRHCLQVIHDEAMAQDLTQETFVHAFAHLSTFEQRARFSTWIWRIAHNLSLNYIKRKKPRETPLKEELLAAPTRSEPGERAEEVKKALGELDEKHRLVCELYLLHRMPQKEIAHQLNIPYGTVRSRLHYGRRLLRKKLPEA